MSPKEIKALVKMLRMCGVTRYKTPELELDLAGSTQGESTSLLTKTRSVRSGPGQPLVPRETAEDKPIEHKVVEMTSLLKLSDQDLVDRLFPDHTEDAEEPSAEAS